LKERDAKPTQPTGDLAVVEDYERLVRGNCGIMNRHRRVAERDAFGRAVLAARITGPPELHDPVRRVPPHEIERVVSCNTGEVDEYVIVDVGSDPSWFPPAFTKAIHPPDI
jgi:hypothetical protein